MKFFAALIAKLAGTSADAPKTLDQCRATFAEAKAGIDRFVAMFTAAALDVDAFLAKGENALKDHLATLQQSITDLTGRAEKAEAAITQAKNDLSAAETKGQNAASALDSLMGVLGLQVADAVVSDANCTKFGVAQDEAFKKLSAADQHAAVIRAAYNHAIAARVTAQLTELGVDPKKLPAQQSQEKAEASELLRQYNALTDAAQRASFWAANFSAMFPTPNRN
ncbi:MAG: hypothetical protein KF897_15115 [Opitutaceae bacterium]|nr:hypothetical protein [Opitutaceae bacterium]